MRIERIHVQRFRSIYDATLECDELTALVGANGAGKSSFLRALEVFYRPKIKVSVDDFYDRNTDEPIVITITYCDLSDEEQAEFRPYYRNGQLHVEKRITCEEGTSMNQVYHGFKLQHEGFADLRLRAKTRINDARSAYQDLKNGSRYQDLPDLTTNLSADETRKELRNNLESWEEGHPGECDLQASSTQFFGAKEVGTGLLEKYTQFVMVPAMSNASTEGVDERGTVINQLVDLVVRNAESMSVEVQRLHDEAQQKLKAAAEALSLTNLEDGLCKAVQQYAPTIDIKLQWSEPIIKSVAAQVEVQVIEDNFQASIDRTGHGVQRAFIIAMLQQLAASSQVQKVSSEDTSTEPTDATSTATTTGTVPSTHLIFAVEEPELFQHPSRQRHFAHVLHELAHGNIPGVAGSTQVLYCTHSPLFVDIDRFENIRLIHKTDGPEQGNPRQTAVKIVRMQNIPAMNQHKLSIMLNPAVNEGFFARRVIVVEGDGDRAYLQMVARYRYKESLEAHGIVVIAVGGNNNIEKPLIVFPEFGIPVYPVWDNDRDKEGQPPKNGKSACTDARKINRRLLSLCGHNPEDWPEGIHDTHAIFSPKLEAIIEHDVTQAGINWPTLQNEVGNQIGGGGLKSHAIVSEIVKRAYERGCEFPFASQIIERVMTLAGIPIQPTASGTTTTSISAASTEEYIQ